MRNDSLPENRIFVPEKCDALKKQNIGIPSLGREGNWFGSSNQIAL
ncbi:hypothetical protein ACHFJ9_20750 [Vibrio sp. D3]